MKPGALVSELISIGAAPESGPYFIVEFEQT
jgi:hypothetical protein